MSIAANISWTPPASTTVRQFRLAVLAAFCAVGCGVMIYVVEKFLLDLPKRFIESPADVMVRAFGTAHFLVGWLFLLTSPSLRSWRAVGRLGVCVLVGVAACLGFAAGGGLRNPLMVMAFYSLFLVHEVRDQADLFLAYGDGDRCGGQVLIWLRRSVCLLFVSVLGSAYLVNGLVFDRHQLLTHASPHLFVGGLLALALTTGAACWRLHREALREHGAFTAFSDAYRPLLSVYAGILAILVLGSLLGSVGFNLLILIHVTSWLVFVSYRLSRRPTAASNLWGWLRHTSGGFLTLHLSIIFAVLVLMALRVYCWQRGGMVSVLLATSSFPYWSFLHIATSFARR